MSKSLSLAELEQSLELSREELVPLLRLFLETASSDQTSLEQAYRNRDLAEISKLAHSFKGVAANLNLDGLLEIVARISNSAKECTLDERDVTSLRSAVNEVAMLLGPT